MQSLNSPRSYRRDNERQTLIADVWPPSMAKQFPTRGYYCNENTRTASSSTPSNRALSLKQSTTPVRIQFPRPRHPNKKPPIRSLSLSLQTRVRKFPAARTSSEAKPTGGRTISNFHKASVCLVHYSR